MYRQEAPRAYMPADVSLNKNCRVFTSYISFFTAKPEMILVKQLVSKEKERFQKDGFDLDLTYITDRIIAMGFPAEGKEGFFRNSMPDVQRFLETYHAGHYKVYNLCAERAYDINKFHGRVEVYPFDDHNAPNIRLIPLFCDSVDKWLNADSKNVVAIHCKAGKGRTGTMICCYLLHAKISFTADQALYFYADKRTKNAKGVTIPSQIRYVKYYEHVLRNGMPPMPRLKLRGIRLVTIPDFDVKGGCDPYVKVFDIYGKELYVSKPVKCHDKDIRTLLIETSLEIEGDIKIALLDKDKMSSDKMCHFWFNTGFLSPLGATTFRLEEIDGASKSKNKSHFKKDFSIEVLYSAIEGNSALTSTVSTPLTTSPVSTSTANIVPPMPRPSDAVPIHNSTMLLLSLPGDPVADSAATAVAASEGELSKSPRSARSPRALLPPSPRGAAAAPAGSALSAGSAFSTKAPPGRPSSPLPSNRITATSGATAASSSLPLSKSRSKSPTTSPRGRKDG